MVIIDHAGSTCVCIKWINRDSDDGAADARVRPPLWPPRPWSRPALSPLPTPSWLATYAGTPTPVLFRRPPWRRGSPFSPWGTPSPSTWSSISRPLRWSSWRRLRRPSWVSDIYKVLNSYWPFPGLMETVGWRRANAANCPTLKPWNICWESPAHLFISPPFDVVPNTDWWRFVLSVVTLWVELGSHPLQNTIAIDGIKSFVVWMGRFLLRMMPKTSLATMSFYCCDKHVSLMFSVPSVNFHYRSIWLQDSFS